MFISLCLATSFNMDKNNKFSEIPQRFTENAQGFSEKKTAVKVALLLPWRNKTKKGKLS